MLKEKTNLGNQKGRSNSLFQSASWKAVLHVSVLVAALGYFVDIYDLLLFSIVRVRSLKDLGLSPEQITDQGLLLINMQMAGMLLGGIGFGILGDKKGRLSILFGSILLYSTANLANAFVDNVTSYAILRFIAGVGLAGELGAGISLVSEVLPKEVRGLGTMIVATIGVSGAAFAWLISEFLPWRTCYIIGGVMGLALLALRVGVVESGMFEKSKKSANVVHGQFLSLFTRPKRFLKYLWCVLIGLQFWFLVGILITLAPEFASQLNVQGSVESGKAVLYCYLGLTVGDMLSGLLSQVFQNRKKVLAFFMGVSGAGLFVYLTANGWSSTAFYWLCFFLGVASGYWALFVTIAAESFGTNLRATVATSVPNFVRGSLVPISALYSTFKQSMGMIQGAAVVGAICVLISFIGLWKCGETFGKDLDFFEES